MKVTYSWLIFSCLSVGIVVYCVRKLEKRQTVSTCIINSEDAFNCSNGLCIHTFAVCDGRADCSDGSDETNDLCAKQVCQSHEYRCQYGACVDKIKKCNGENDCVDGSDENLTECKQSSINRTININGSSKCLEDQYKCKSGQCIEGISTCDGTRDCMDGSDKENCVDRNPISEPITLKPVNNTTQPTTQYNTKKLCVLPTVEGVVYSYEDSDEILPHGTLINHYRTIIENCENEYHKAYPNSVRVCQENGEWRSNVEKLCFKMCPSLISDSLNINCTLNGNYANCSNPSIPDTIAITSCIPTYIIPTGQEETQTELLCQSNGTWNNQLYKCIPHCGRPFVEHQLLIDNGKTAHVRAAPWNVGVYQLEKISSNYDLICGGSLIASNLVISAAHCFYEKNMLSNIISINDGLYKIAVGKYSRDLTVIDNDFTQIMNVETIYLKKDYHGQDGFHLNDIAVIVLKNRVTISIGVAPVCVDWNNRYNLTNGTQGKIVGWGKTEKEISSPVLLEATLPYIDYNSCRGIYTNGFDRYVTIDKFCAGSANANGPGVRKGDSGAGLMFVHSDFYYLTGVVSLKDPNTNNSIAVFTDFKYHLQWVRELYNKYTSYASDGDIFKINIMDTENLCVLPIVDGVIYSEKGSTNILTPGSLISEYRTVIENCEEGFHKAYSNSVRVCQGNGKWFPNSEKLCFKMCPPLLSDSLIIHCTLNGNYANCSNPSIPDTVAIPSCKESHTVPINEQEETSNVLYCQSNGMWSKQLYRCISYCGKPYARHQLLIDNGKTAHVGIAPWNVGIYRFNNESSKYDLICGGSIIAPNLVISAAHCFTNQSMKFNTISINGVYKIAVGKYNRYLTVIDNDFTQIIDVDTIYVRIDYDGPNGFYCEDLAVIALTNRINIGIDVAPVCIDWNGIYNLTNGTQGKIVGWEKMEKNISNPVLLEATLPYIDHNSCRSMYTKGFQTFVTVDKFCAESVFGQGVHEVENGAGLMFLHSNYYYLTGVVSVKDPNINNSIAVFQDIRPYFHWIHGLYNKYKSYSSDNISKPNNIIMAIQ